MKFSTLYIKLNAFISNLTELVNNEDTNRPFSSLSEEELKNLSPLERELITIYNRLYDDELKENEIIELKQFSNALYEFNFKDFDKLLLDNITISVTNLLEENKLEDDCLYNFELGDKFKNHSYEKMKNIIINKIYKSENTFLEKRKEEIKFHTRKYLTIKCFSFLENGKLINSPSVQVW
ncbi:hypothetical protein [Peribacillus simplex]|uniref:hypothetical protein n=1 Tax=Peribacillus simplex TaxID=1478 RepID=UPI003D274FAD